MEIINYKPIVPKWVAETLEREKHYGINYPFKCSGQMRKEWDEWKRRYSRKLKYARLNGWRIED